MLASLEHRFVFVHVQKTGGDTVRRLLKEHFDGLESIAAKHDPAAQGKAHLEKRGAAWDDLFSFAVVRNPWARLVSWYRMIEEASRLRWYHQLAGGREKSHYWQARRSPVWRYVLDHADSFEQFVKRCTEDVSVQDGPFEARYSFARPQFDYLTDAGGTVMVDFVGRFEHFEDDMREAFGRLGVDLGPLPHENKSAHRHYSTYYTPETREIVRERFRPDIEHFGYAFEAPAASQA